MSYNNLSSERVTEIEARITQLESQLTSAYVSLGGSLNAEGVQSFRLDTGEGSQSAQYRSPEYIQKTISWLWSQIDFWNRKLNGTSNRTFTLRRKINDIYGEGTC